MNRLNSVSLSDRTASASDSSSRSDASRSYVNGGREEKGGHIGAKSTSGVNNNNNSSNYDNTSSDNYDSNSRRSDPKKGRDREKDKNKEKEQEKKKDEDDLMDFLLDDSNF